MPITVNPTGLPVLPGQNLDNPTNTPQPISPPTVSTDINSTQKPTAVVSSGTAMNDYQNKTDTVNQASESITQNQARVANAGKPGYDVFGNPIPAGTVQTEQPKENTSLTPEQQLMNTPEQGNQFIYNKQTGERKEVPMTDVVSPEFTKTDVANAPAKDTVTTSNQVIKQFADGSYGMFEASSGKYIGQATAQNFNDAKGAQKAKDDLVSIQNGTYPLTPDQQGQISSITTYYSKLIEQQKQANQSLQNAVTGNQYMSGIVGTDWGVGLINKTISDGSQKIQALNDEMNSKVQAMKAAIKTDNINLVNTLYSKYQDGVEAKQKEIDTMHSAVQDQINKNNAAMVSMAEAMGKKYTDTKEPILPTDTPEEVRQKLMTSPKWASDNAIAKTLNDDENAYFADMLTSGFDMKKILPNLGYGTAGTQQKIAVLKPMIDKAQNAGLTGNEFGAAMIDKTAKASAFSKLEARKDVIASNENAVVNDFDKVLLPAAAKLSTSQWATMSPALNRWLQLGTLQATGDETVNNFLGSLTTTLTKYASVVSGNVGAGGTTANMNNELQKVLSSGLSYQAIKSYVENVAKPEMKNTVGGFDNTQQGIKDFLNTSDGTFSDTPTTSSGGNSGAVTQVKTNTDGTLQAVDF